MKRSDSLIPGAGYQIPGSIRFVENIQIRLIFFNSDTC
jgi:hypothetical protein